MAQTALTRFSFLPRPRGGAFLLPCIRHGAGLLFYLAAIQTHAIVYSVFCAAHAVYTSHDIKQHTGLYRRFYCDYARSSAANTRPTHAAIIPPAPRWSVSQRRSASSAYQIPPSRPDAAQVSTAAYHASPAGSSPTVCGSLASAAPCAPADGSTSPPVQGQPGGGFDASHARRLTIWPGSAVRAHRVRLAPSTRRSSPVAGTRWAARNHWRLPPYLFSGFRPIAN